MSYGEIVRVRAPIETYRTMHHQIGELLGTDVPAGAILHVARETDDGFEVIEVWDSKANADAFKRETLTLAIEKLGTDAAGPPPQFESFAPTTAITFGSYSTDSSGRR